VKTAGRPAFALKLDFTPATGRLTRNRRSLAACASTEAGTILELLLFLSRDEDFGRCGSYSIAHLQWSGPINHLFHERFPPKIPRSVPPPIGVVGQNGKAAFPTKNPKREQVVKNGTIAKRVEGAFTDVDFA
jgi:hypothetical protein